MSRRVPGPIVLLAGLLAIYLVAPLVAGVHEAQLASFGSVDVRALLQASGVSVASATVASVLLALGELFSRKSYVHESRSGRAGEAILRMQWV